MGVSSHIIDFSQLYKFDLDLVGEKACQLGELKHLGILIPDGFVISTAFFKEFLQQTEISEKIEEVQKLNHSAIAESIEKLFEPIKKEIMYTAIPENLTLELYKFYKKLAGTFKEPSLNIFSSSPENNKYIMFEDVKGDANFILKIKTIWASQLDNPIAIVVQKNVKSKIKGSTTTNNPTKELENLAKKIEKHFYFPQVIDYVIQEGNIYVTSIKPFTGNVKTSEKPTLQNRKTQNVLIKGISINPGIVTGPVKILNNNSRLQIKNGEIIVLSQLSKFSFSKIKKAKGVVSDAILLNSYDQMLYRKSIKIPTITGAVNATKILQNGNIITVNGMNGEIYRGSLI